MTHNRDEVWTCDSCGASKSIRIGVNIPTSPAGWACLTINHRAADPALDADGWHRYQLCSDCIPVLQDGNFLLIDLRGLAERADRPVAS